MPPRPFPFQLGIGTDIAHVRRVRQILEKTEGNRVQLNRYLRRFLTPWEQDNFLHRYRGWDVTSTKAINHMSKRLAGRYVKTVPW